MKKRYKEEGKTTKDYADHVLLRSTPSLAAFLDLFCF